MGRKGTAVESNYFPPFLKHYALCDVHIQHCPIKYRPWLRLVYRRCVLHYYTEIKILKFKIGMGIMHNLFCSIFPTKTLEEMSKNHVAPYFAIWYGMTQYQFFRMIGGALVYIVSFEFIA